MYTETKKAIKWFLIGFAILFAIITLFNSFKSIPTGYVGVKTRFGEVQNTMMNEGIILKYLI